MAHVSLPDFSRLALRTDARDTVAEEIMAETNDAGAARLLSLANQLLENANRKIATKNIDSMRQAAEHANRYKEYLDSVRSLNPGFKFTDVWMASVKQYATFLKRALEELNSLDTDIHVDMRDPNEIIDKQAYLEKREVLEYILTNDDGTPWETYGAKVPLGAEGYRGYRARLLGVMETVQRTMDILNTLPDTPYQQTLWRTDLLNVMRQAASTRTVSEMDVARELENLRQAREGGSRNRMEADLAHRALEIPDLTPHMKLIHGLIMDEVDDIKRMIDRQGMRAGKFVEETVDFGDFGIGRAKIQVRVNRAESDVVTRKPYYIRWYRPGDVRPIDIQSSIGATGAQNRYVARSDDDLKRFLHWLDQNALSDRARRRARTWVLRPSMVQTRTEGGG
jgi:hypothetical protein